MNDNFFYDIDEILRALDHYQGDPFFSQQLIDLWGLNVETQVKSKKNIARLTDR